uniref:Uncharacterized protein n=1 Tax=Oryza punctata TaxID=4537 RepID=A0A0E0LJP1_ORYPU
MPHARPHMIPQMTPDVPTSHWQGGFAPFAGTSQGIPTIPRVEAEFIGQGEFTSLGGQSPLTSNFTNLIDYLLPDINRAYSVGSTACTYIWHQPMSRTIHARRLVVEYRIIWTCCNKVIGYLVNIPRIVMKFHISKHRQQALHCITASYHDMSSFGGGSSSVPNELRASQTDDASQVTQPTQPEDGDLQGNNNDPHRSNRERHEPNRLSLSGPRHAAGGRKKTTKKRADTSRTMTDHDDE